jgi:hypothetical protein
MGVSGHSLSEGLSEREKRDNGAGSLQITEVSKGGSRHVLDPTCCEASKVVGGDDGGHERAGAGGHCSGRRDPVLRLAQQGRRKSGRRAQSSQQVYAAGSKCQQVPPGVGLGSFRTGVVCA